MLNLFGLQVWRIADRDDQLRHRLYSAGGVATVSPRSTRPFSSESWFFCLGKWNPDQVHPPPADTVGMKSAVRRLPRLPALVVSLGLLLVPSAGQCEARFTNTVPSASASLDFRIIIPPVMRVLENSHPWQLDAGADGSLAASQRLVVLSNMKHGFCVTLRLAAPAPGEWQVDAATVPGVSLQPAGDGWRLCSARPGRYTLQLQHRFARTAHGQTPGTAWPVQTDITTL